MAPDLVPVSSLGVERRHQDFDLERSHATKQVFFILFKRKWLILSLFLAFTTAAGIAMALRPRVYTAAAKVLLKGDRISLQISGLPGLSGKLGYSAQVMQSEVEFIRSRAVLMPVAEKLVAGNSASPALAAGPALDDTLSTLQDSLVPAALPDSNVIQVSYFGPTPEEAQRNLRLVLDQYMEQQMMVHSGSGKLVTFYKQEKDRVAAELWAAEEQWASWKKANNIVSIDEQITHQLELLKSLEAGAQQTDAQIQSTKSRVAALEQQRRAQPTHLVTSRERVMNPLITKVKAEIADAEVALNNLDSDPLVVKLKTDLVTAEVALNDLLQRYTEQDRRVQEKREQIAALRGKLASARKEAELITRDRIAELRHQLAAAEKEANLVGTETTASNPLRDTLDRELAIAQALLPSLVAQRDAIAKQIREAVGSLAVLRENKREAERLTRAVGLRADALKVSEQKLQEAGLAVGLDREQLASVAVIEAPHWVPQGGDLRRRVGMVVLAGIVGLVVGITIAFGFEFFNPTLRTRDDVEQYVGLPVLATIPELEGRRLALER